MGDALLLGVIASIFDSFTSCRRVKQVVNFANSSPEQIAALDKRNIYPSAACRGLKHEVLTLLGRPKCQYLRALSAISLG